MRLYLDVTDTFNQWRGSPTGIQRTLIGLALAARECPDVLLAAKEIDKPVWYNVPYESFLAIFQRSAPFKTSTEDLAKAGGCQASTMHEDGENQDVISELEPAPPPTIVFPPVREVAGKLARWLFWQMVPAGLSKKWNEFNQPRALPPQSRPRTQVHSHPSSQPRTQALSTPLRTHENHLPISWKHGDTLFIADSNWRVEGYFEALGTIKDRVGMIGFIYDLIPIEYPHFVPDGAVSFFRNWIIQLIATSDVVLTDSAYSARRIGAFAAEHAHFFAKPKIAAIRFGNRLSDEELPADRKQYQPSLGSLLIENATDYRDRPASILEAKEWILWLGSIDVRKNMDVVLLAFKHLYSKRLISIPLVIAGREMPDSDHYIRQISFDPDLVKNVSYFKAPSDNFVRSLFDGAKLFVFSSWAEGYGLPVAEALQHGVPVVASNATSIPEVAGDLIDYFEPWDSAALSSLILKYLTDGAYFETMKERARSFKPTCWRLTMEDIKRRALECMKSDAASGA